MRICFFGTYPKGSGNPRIRVLKSGLKLAGAEILECNMPVWGEAQDKTETLRSGMRGLFKFRPYLSAWAEITRQYKRSGPFDLLLVPHFGYLDIFLASVLTRGQSIPVVLDGFVSLADTVVEDRRLVSKGSWKATLLQGWESLALNLADRILVDTHANRSFLSTQYRIPDRKFLVVPLGEEDPHYLFPHPVPDKNTAGPNRLDVLFFGTYIPLHGLNTVVQAAHLLEKHPSISFTMVGRGQEYERISKRVAAQPENRITLEPGWMPPSRLAERILCSDLCLGIFGTSQKAARVVPSKAFIATALGKPVLTRDSPAIREMFIPGEEILVCPPGDPVGLARTLLAAAEDPALLERIAKGGKEAFHKRFTPETIGKVLLKDLESILPPRADAPVG